MECMKCKKIMLKDFNIVIDSQLGGLQITTRNIPSKAGKVKPKVAVCPSCGHIEFYTDDLDALANFQE